MFIFLLFLIPFLLLSCKSLIMMWIFIEINTFCFIILLMNHKLMNEQKSLMIYFCVQTFSSMMMILYFIHNLNFKSMMMMTTILLISVMIKLSMTPFHSWIIKIMYTIKKFMSLILITWQKLIPLIILIMLLMFMNMIILILINLLISTLTQIMMNSFIIMMVFSSMFNLSWILMSMILKNLILFFMFLFIYTIMILKIFFIMEWKNNLYIYMNKFKQNIMMIWMISLGGLPPFIGFMPKWMTIKFSFKNLILFITLIILTMFSLIQLSIYFKFMKNLMNFKKLYSMKIDFQVLKNNWINLLIPMILILMI